MASASVQPATIVQKGNRRSIPDGEDMEYPVWSTTSPQSQNKAKPFALSIERRERSKVERRHLSSHTDWFNLQFQSYRRQSSHKRADTLHLRDQHHGITTESTSVDDIIETVNHFRCIDYVIDHATERISERHIKQLHSILKANTSDSNKSWFAVGDYKYLPNEVGREETTKPKEGHSHMKNLIDKYNAITTVKFDDILDFHVIFERIHPFQDGNGRIGRLLLLWQCLQSNNNVPFIITEELRLFYYRGIQNWGTINGYLRDTCLTAQDNYKQLLDYFEIKY